MPHNLAGLRDFSKKRGPTVYDPTVMASASSAVNILSWPLSTNPVSSSDNKVEAATGSGHGTASFKKLSCIDIFIIFPFWLSS
jgi:hypothetical protein